jgi:hypothetical protein
MPGMNPDVHTTREVHWSYVRWVGLPVVAAPLLGQSAAFAMDRSARQGSGGGIFMAVMVVAWIVVVTGTIVLGRRFSVDRGQSDTNAATGWCAASIALAAAPLGLTALLLVFGLGLAMLAGWWN